MIQGIQNVSFSGNGAKLVKTAMKNAEEAYVSASSNLEGTVNAKVAERLAKKATFAEDKNTLMGRVASLRASKGNISSDEISKSLARVEAEKAAEKAAAKAAPKAEVAEFTFFG